MAMKRAMTLIEIVVYFGLFALAAATLTTLFIISSRTQRQVYADALVSGRTASALAVLRRDFQATALASITAYPNASESGERPGVSLASGFNKDGHFSVNAFGAPQWDANVYYTLEPQTDLTGRLVRWEQEVSSKNFLPQLAPSLPSSQGTKQHTLLENLLLPNKTIEGVGEGGSYSSDEHGGFEVKFVRREGGPSGTESTSAENPRSQAASGNTRLVEITLRVLRQQSSYPPSLFVQTIRVCPRH